MTFLIMESDIEIKTPHLFVIFLMPRPPFGYPWNQHIYSFPLAHDEFVFLQNFLIAYQSMRGLWASHSFRDATFFSWI